MPCPRQAVQAAPEGGEISARGRCPGRAAPAATDARSRLSTVFVEWMMGLAAQLKALGNGVVPQQAAGAVRLLLDRAHRT